MKIKVRLFGYVAERVGRREMTIEVDEPATVDKVLATAGIALPRSVRVAVNTEYTGLKSVVHGGDVLSLIPPVGGG